MLGCLSVERRLGKAWRSRFDSSSVYYERSWKPGFICYIKYISVRDKKIWISVTFLHILNVQDIYIFHRLWIW